MYIFIGHFFSCFYKICQLQSPLVMATIEIYRTAISKLLPTPTKSHYTFNLRDLAKVIQGVCLSKPDVYGDDKNKFIRLWIHEEFRVFADRLVDDTDIAHFLEWVSNAVETHFKVKFNEICQRLDVNKTGVINTPDQIRSLMFGFYMDEKGINYDEVTDISEMRNRFTNYLEEYNQISKTPMNIVLFQFALEHISRICRVLKQRGGNVMLVGVGGSGKQSLTKMAAYVCGYDIASIELTNTYGITEFHEDLIKILKNAGVKAQPLVFLFTDNHIKEESFLEDINSILNSGEVPNLFPMEDKAEILEAVAKDAARANRTDVNFFIFVCFLFFCCNNCVVLRQRIAVIHKKNMVCHVFFGQHACNINKNCIKFKIHTNGY